MKSVLALVILCLLGCDKMPHLVWSNDKKNEKIQINKPQLNDSINGVIFTLDDGVSLVNTPKVLDILKHNNLQAIFFVEGVNLAGNSEQAIERRELLKRTTIEGHIIGNHSYSHHLFTTMSLQKVEWEINTTTKLIEDTTGQKVSLIRLPYGKSNGAINALLKKKQLTPVYWTYDLREYELDPMTHSHKTKEQLLATFIEQYNKYHIEQGIKKTILLLHDTKNITPDVLPLIINYLNTNK